MWAGGRAFEEVGPVERVAGGCRMLHGDEAAASDLAGDEAFGLQEFVGGCDGGTVQSK